MSIFTHFFLLGEFTVPRDVGILLTSYSILGIKKPLPPQAATPEEDETLLEDEPFVMPPLHADYGTNVRIGKAVFINFNCTFIDTCIITIGARTLVGPNVSIFSGTHPEDPLLRNGTKGPESGKPVVIGEDCWIAGNVTILPGVTIGRGCVVGAGAVVTKNIPPLWIAVGNPARLLRPVKSEMKVDEKTGEITVPEGALE
jgi:acetyltransferase-like isoleucine patch superfamily enzyme